MIAQIHPNDKMAKGAIFSVLNKASDKRITSKNLDFWRGSYKNFMLNKAGGDTIFLVKLIDGEVVGISCCAILRNSLRCFNSITVVSKNVRRKGIGSELLKAKVKLIETRYPGAFMFSSVAERNSASVRMCESAGLALVGTNLAKAGTPDEYIIRTYSNIVAN